MSVQVPNGVVDVAVARRGRRRRRREASTSPTSRAPVASGPCADQRLLRHAIPENRLRVYDVRARDRDASPTPARCSSCGPPSGVGMVTALVRHRGPAGRPDRQQPATSAARSTPTAATRPRASCSSATPSTCRSSRCATRPASWSAPRSRRPRWCATSRACSSRPPTSRVPLFTIVLRKGYGLGAQAMAGGSVHALVLRSWPGRPASSAAWGWRAR